jgi:cytochrome c oxidase subunit 3
LDPFDIPLVNTVILVYSGFTVTLSHLFLRRGNKILSCYAMLFTIILGLSFLYIQKDEFLYSAFDISDGIYGSTFFMLTGFHGGHVIIGVLSLIIVLYRTLELHFSSYSHTGFKLALLY